MADFETEKYGFSSYQPKKGFHIDTAPVHVSIATVERRKLKRKETRAHRKYRQPIASKKMTTFKHFFKHRAQES